MLPRSIGLAFVVLAAAVPAASAQQQQPMQGMWGGTGQYRGSNTPSGQIYSPDGRYIGQVQRPSTAPSVGDGGFGRGTMNGASNARRQQDAAQPVYGANGQYLGQVNRSGQFHDAQGVYRGQMR